MINLRWKRHHIGMKWMSCGQTFLSALFGFPESSNAPSLEKCCISQYNENDDILGVAIYDPFAQLQEIRTVGSPSVVLILLDWPFLMKKSDKLDQNQNIWAVSRPEGQTWNLVALGSACVYFKVCHHSFHIIHIFSSRLMWLCKVCPVGSLQLMGKIKAHKKAEVSSQPVFRL